MKARGIKRRLEQAIKIDARENENHVYLNIEAGDEAFAIAGYYRDEMDEARSTRELLIEMIVKALS